METVLVLNPFKVVFDEPDGFDVCAIFWLLGQSTLKQLVIQLAIKDCVLEGKVELTRHCFVLADLEAVSVCIVAVLES